ncbi:MAG TPA: hypothetical protein DEH78_33010 [Solibacterales bacterium]|nr:hypothetical protein [Bryobacterales bacterium]
MPVAVLCHAAADTSLARTLAQHIAATTPFATERHVLEDGETLLDCFDRGADATLLIASPHSVPARPDRTLWQPLVDCDASIAIFEAQPSRVPAIVPQKKLVTGDSRRLRQWLLSLLAAEPRVVGVPDEYPLDDAGDFERVIGIDASGRSLHGVVGDLAWRLNLSLPFPLERNLAALRAHCERHCYLVIVAGGEPLDLGPLTAVRTTPHRIPPLPPETLVAAPADHSSLAAMERSFRATGHPILGQRAVTLAIGLQRHAEALEFLDLLRPHASLSRWIEHESGWIRELWGEGFRVPADSLHQGVQTAFSF